MSLPPLDPNGGIAPIVGVRLPREQRARVIERAGTGRGALSEFVRAAIGAELERAEAEGRAPPGDDGGQARPRSGDTIRESDPSRG